MVCLKDLKSLNNMKNKKIKAVAASLLCCLLFTSCDDEKLAKQMEGTWQSSYVTTYDTGAKERIEKVMTFMYDESDEMEDGGTFVEELYGNTKDIELVFVDGTVDCRYRSSIRGTWSVDFGDLYLTYNVATLEVEVKNSDVDLKLNRVTDQLNMAGYMMETFSNPKDDIVREAQKNIYKELFHHYKQHNADDGAFADLKVSVAEMSFETSDIGRIKFHRVSSSSEKEYERKTSSTSKAG